MFLHLLRSIIRIMPFLYIGFIWYLSSHPSDAIIYTGFSFDAALKESLHLVEFAILFVSAFFALITLGIMPIKANRLAAALAVSFGFVDELHQYFVPYRSATVTDLLKDIAGVVILYCLFNHLYYQQRKSKIGILLHRLVDILQPEKNKQTSDK